MQWKCIDIIRNNSHGSNLTTEQYTNFHVTAEEMATFTACK